MSLEDLDREYEREQREVRRKYRKLLKGKTIKDVHTWVSCLGGLSSLTIYLTDGTALEVTTEGIGELKSEWIPPRMRCRT